MGDLASTHRIEVRSIDLRTDQLDARRRLVTRPDVASPNVEHTVRVNFEDNRYLDGAARRSSEA